MASWRDVEASAPELAAAARGFFDAHGHKTLATLRRDGSPRISGQEAWFWDGELWFGSMWQARKARDLQRDARFALHSASEDPDVWRGDAKVSGRAEEITDSARFAEVAGARTGETPSGPWHLFRADVLELVVVTLPPERDRLLIDVWTPAGGVRRIER